MLIPRRRMVVNSVWVTAAAILTVALTLSLDMTMAFTPTTKHHHHGSVLNSVSPDLSAEEALARTRNHLQKLQQRSQLPSMVETNNPNLHPQQKMSIAQETLYQQYVLQSANSLKQELQRRKLNTKGRKPDLARRLATHQVKKNSGGGLEEDDDDDTALQVVEPTSLVDNEDNGATVASDNDDIPYPVSFAGLALSRTAATALHQAGFLRTPSPIQAAALPAMAQGESVLLHAPTGSGKTIAYVLPATEFLWRQQQMGRRNGGGQQQLQFALIVTPTRELAAQVAGVASTLAPPGSVRLLSHPTNLLSDGSKDKKDRDGEDGRGGQPLIIVGSAKTVVHSLYGNDQYPASPTPKPAALQFLKSVRVLVLDEVDRLLAVQSAKKRESRSSSKHDHEKPAAILAAAVARHTLGRAQIVAASATVGRPLKRELARVLGLPPPKGPRVIVAQAQATSSSNDNNNQQEQKRPEEDSSSRTVPSSSRLVTIPDTVEHYIAAVAPKQDSDDKNNNNNDSTATAASSGQLLIKAYQVIQEMVSTGNENNQSTRILMVLARGFGISTNHVIGALQHFNCQPEPQSLLDALHENALEGTDHMMQVHRQVSGATGVGQSSTTAGGGAKEATTTAKEKGDAPSSSSSAAASSSTSPPSSLWVTGEDTIRGLHLDGLDVVIVVGRPRGPDEYTHIAGRTGRAGKSGKVVAVVAQDQAPLLRAWETMLQMEWRTYGTTYNEKYVRRRTNETE